MKSLIIVFSLVFLTACNSKSSGPSSIDGKYTSSNGKLSYVFTSNGKVKANIFGTNEEANYTIKDNIINYQFEGGMPRTASVNSDGSLTTDTGDKFNKN
jgi:hypothetical protein